MANPSSTPPRPLPPLLLPHPNRLIPQPLPPTAASSSSSSSPNNNDLDNHPNGNNNSSRRRSASSPIVASPGGGNAAPPPTNDDGGEGGSTTIIHLTSVSTIEQLRYLPSEFLSSSRDDDATANGSTTNENFRPLLHVDANGNEYTYYLKPMSTSIMYILLIEIMERFCFYGINYTATAYLTGEYNDDWNADMPSVTASSYVSISTAVAYTTPFVGALLADNVLGEYMTILSGCTICYMPGLALIALTTIPSMSLWPLFDGRNFNKRAVDWGLLVLWPLGTGMVKSCVNVFGAKQFHPILQSSMIECYYVNFYMCINIGALAGGVVVPILAQWNVTVAYFMPICILGLGVCLFVAGTRRYVRPVPMHNVGAMICDALGLCGGGGGGGGACRYRTSKKLPKHRNYDGITQQPQQRLCAENCTDENVRVGIGTIALLSGLVVPFNVAYSQMATTFIVQGTIMRKYWIIDAPLMNNADAVSVLAFGYLIGNVIYPELSRRKIKIPTTYKFAIGSAFGAWAVLCAIITDYRIHNVYRKTGEDVTVLWQIFPYLLIGIGEIFAVSAAYELAFTVAPPKMKAIASAANLFMVGGFPNVLCILLYNACGGWFLNADGVAKIHKLNDYADAHVVNCFWVVEAISLFGVFINILPCVRDWVADIETMAAETIKTPMSTPIIRKNLMMRKRQEHRRLSSARAGTVDDEESPLIKAERHAQYLEYGDGPSLNKFGSMRAGPGMKKASGGIK